MNSDFVAWLSTQRLPMFDITRLQGAKLWTDGRFMTEAYEIYQEHPEKRLVFECTLDELWPLVQSHFPQLRTAVGELAVKTAIEDLRLCPWWGSAGPITEQIRYLLREGFKQLPRYQRPQVLRSKVSQVLSNVVK